MSYKHQWMGWMVAVALCQVTLFACDDSNDNAGPEEVSSAGRSSSSSKGGSAGKSSAGKGGSDTASTASGVSSEAKGGSGGASAGKGGSGAVAGKGGSASAPKAGSGGSSESSEPQDCTDQGPKDCICEAPKTDAQFLNHCSAATCSPYDNKKLTKLKADGTLPALP